MTAVVIALIFGSITLVLKEGVTDVAAGRISGGSIAAFVLTGGLVAGAFGGWRAARLSPAEALRSVG